MHANISKSTKNYPKSMKMRSWSIFGAKSRPGRLQDAPRQLGYSTFGASLVENVASRVDFWPCKIQNRSKIRLVGLDRRLGPPKIVSGRGFGKYMKI